MLTLETAWSTNMRLKNVVRYMEGRYTKQEVVQFWRDSAKKLGYSGSYPVLKLKRNAYLAAQASDNV